MSDIDNEAAESTVLAGERALSKPTKPWWRQALVLLLVAIVSAVGGCALGIGSTSISSFRDSSSITQTTVDGEKSVKEKIALIPIQGIILESMGQGPDSVSSLMRSLKAVEEDKHFVGVLLAIDTPGGGVTASDRMYHELEEFKARTKLPVHAMCYDIAASGGYYVAMASDHITAHPTSIVGSIGVISKFFNLSGAMDKLGVSLNVVKSLNSKGQVSFKDIGSPYRPMRPEERALLQGLITEMWHRFTAVVTAGRKGKITPEHVLKLADGRVFTGTQALKEGLIDAVGYRQDAYQSIRKTAGYPEARIVSFKKPAGLKEMLGLESGIGLRENSFGLASEGIRRLLTEESGFFYMWTTGASLAR